MSEEKKYVTFRDLRAVAKPEPEQIDIEKSAVTSTSSIPSTPSYTSTPSSTSTTQLKEPTKKPSIAPERDFQRIPNSVTRSAIPDGVFRGKSKQVWDYLWSVSRGAVSPVRSVRKSRREIKAGAGLGSMVTVDAALEHLEKMGLIRIRPAIGSLIGNEYEVFTPEETATSTSSTSSATSLTQKVDILDVLDSSISSTTQTVDNNATYRPPNTSFKTDDDETHTLAEFTETLIEATRCVVGGKVINSKQERERWHELGELLAEELKEAAQRTNAISSVPAFFTAHLRRRLARKPAVLAETKKSSEASPRTYQTFATVPEKNDVRETGKASEDETLAKGRSKFSLEECRRYADHLHTTGQGITNPGGFALTIYRSGISDAFIEKFLHPNDEMPVDASACETCKGTGFYYPHGAEQGVAKCKHKGLKKGARRRLKPEEIVEQADIIGELIESGYTMEQAEAQFAASLDADDWAVIRTRLEGKKSL
jgi:hypothetical protein